MYIATAINIASSYIKILNHVVASTYINLIGN